jgi:hypothetical protein
VTSPDGAALRREVQPAGVFDATVDAGDAEAAVLVQVIYPEPRDALSYAYAARPGEDGTISVAVPPASTGAVVRMAVSAEGRLPALLPDLYAEDFWADADRNGYEPFLSYSVDLPPGDPLADAMAVGSDGRPIRSGGFPSVLVIGLVLAGSAVAGVGVWWVRRSHPAAASAAAGPPPPLAEPLPPPDLDGPEPPPTEP